ncbi:MAG: ketose-bisphosphate aldolase [Alphaproteobacteria bacterium]|nr:ketose-bisphosphate aldolase [Alphaproteobacteria bacterium]MBQ6011630.1 ketose-bisphosphate aldolase [Alphaproteobacteria bacterium]
MHYSNFGLSNTKRLLTCALRDAYAVPAFNFYNMETLNAILNAAEITQSPIILAVSESALEYMGDDILMGMIAGAKYKKNQIALHLDHGHSFESCKNAIDLGFSSVMFDGSALPLADNIKISRRVADYAHKFDVSVETELGILSGIEDKNTKSKSHAFTDPDLVYDFVKQTKTDSLAIAIGTSHGAYKRKNKNESLRFDILEQIAKNIPNTPLVLHGASTIPQKYVNNINKFGGDIKNAYGIAPAQIRHAISLHIAKVNFDSDLRLAFTSAVREYLFKNKSVFNPRDYLSAAKEEMTKTCIDTIQNIMGSGYKI